MGAQRAAGPSRPQPRSSWPASRRRRRGCPLLRRGHWPARPARALRPASACCAAGRARSGRRSRAPDASFHRPRALRALRQGRAVLPCRCPPQLLHALPLGYAVPRWCRPPRLLHNLLRRRRPLRQPCAVPPARARPLCRCLRQSWGRVCRAPQRQRAGSQLRVLSCCQDRQQLAVRPAGAVAAGG